MVNLDRRLPRPGCDLRFFDSGGTGHGVVFTHGAGVDHSMFDAQARAAQEAGFRVICWDLRGHGASVLDDGIRFRAADALDDLVSLVGHLELERPTLIGHSLGGNLSQTVVKRHPGLAAGLIIVDSTWNAGPLTIMERFGLRLAAPLLALVPAARLPELMAKASATTPAGVAYARECFALMPKRVFLDVWRATLSLVDPDPDALTPVPLTLIRGAEDRTGNITAAMPRWAAAENIAEHVIPTAGHISPLDAPGRVSSAILNALISQSRSTEHG
ncbi:alpha/beta fold hydrolase [Microbacterium murale]|uniref:Pimeloyl-ACP methyl ester carboxylesterase n=1 Tax=Microbacterium murale TaxID=1081040 RepID=A0ABU0P3S8_9MICO|nr:alpha/beta hydrolase [Microbacterium murale]MDQ0641991.1 pimeloyl-ACP methyl ester carboxylesterase [Microbacterium murale]